MSPAVVLGVRLRGLAARLDHMAHRNCGSCKGWMYCSFLDGESEQEELGRGCRNVTGVFVARTLLPFTALCTVFRRVDPGALGHAQRCTVQFW